MRSAIKRYVRLIAIFLPCSYLFRTAIQAIAAYLDAFQKIADAATNSKGKFLFSGLWVDCDDVITIILGIMGAFKETTDLKASPSEIDVNCFKSEM